MKRGDVTRWKQDYIRTPLPPYFIVLASSVKTKEVEVIDSCITLQTRKDDQWQYYVMI